MWFVYIILCEDSSLYTGSSNDLEKRFLNHKSGKAAKYTKSHRAIKLLYKERVGNKSEALKRENEIKSWKREDKIKFLKLDLSS